MDLTTIELHDAIVKSISADCTLNTVIIDVDFYKSKDDDNRTPALIIFDRVDSLSQVTNFGALQKNAFAGHINEWVPAPAQGNGTTYIDMVGGCIAINAKTVRFDSQG